jgi:uncharacterized protein (DUF433 family)
MDIRELITIDKAILGGTPVFRGTRVPVSTLFDHLKYGQTLNDFLEDFPSVKREQALQLLEVADRILNHTDPDSWYEAAA